MEFLHSNMLVEILRRLPCKDIAICKCVCKDWYQLLSHPNFTKYYTTHSPFTSFSLIHPNSSLQLLESHHGNGCHLTTPMEAPQSDVACTCNGLIFFLSQSGVTEKLYCCNPLLTDSEELLAEYDVLPRQPSPESPEIFFAAHIPSSSSYKLLRILPTGFSRVQEAHVLSVGVDGGWRRLDDELTRGLESTGVCLNGQYMWISEDEEEVRYLSAFELGEEKFGLISKLPEMLQKVYNTMFLVVLKNCITVIDFTDYDKIGIWRMEGDEYGVREDPSWLRMVVMKKPSVDIPHELSLLYAIAVLPNGDKFIISLFHGQTLDELKHLRVAEFTPRFSSIL